MSGLSFKRRRILNVLARTLSSHTDSWEVFRDAFGDYSTGAAWQAKKYDTLLRMSRLGLVEEVKVAGPRDSYWRITDKGRRVVARTIAKGAAA